MYDHQAGHEIRNSCRFTTFSLQIGRDLPLECHDGCGGDYTLSSYIPAKIVNLRVVRKLMNSKYIMSTH